MQRYGSGFEKILEEYKYYDKKFQPKITSEQSWFTITLTDVAYTSNEKPVNITPQLSKIQKMVYNIILNNPGLNGLVSTKWKSQYNNVVFRTR